jgi:hypothetical protein
MAGLGPGLLAGGLDVQNEQEYRGNQHKQDTGHKTELVNFHERLPLLSTNRMLDQAIINNAFRISLSPPGKAEPPRQPLDLMESDIQAPVEPIFNAPVAAGSLGKALYSAIKASEIVALGDRGSLSRR